MSGVQIARAGELQSGFCPLNDHVADYAKFLKVKVEDGEKWNATDVLIAKTIVWNTEIDPTGTVSFADLLKRLEDEIWINSRYLSSALRRILQNPPTLSQGLIIGLKLK